jgi:hypothetical protein
MIDEKIHYLLLLIGEVKRAVERREMKKVEYMEYKIELDAKQNALNKIPTSNQDNEEFQKKKESLEKIEKNTELSQEIYNNVTKKLLNEFELFKIDKSRELTTIVENIVLLQVYI